MNEEDRCLRIAYALQNVGGIDFAQDMGDTVPVKQTLLRLQRAGHQVRCLQLRGRTVAGLDDVSATSNGAPLPQGLSATRPFLAFESGVRRAQRTLRLPYYALFDTYRFYEACLRALPGYDLCHEHNGLFCGGAALACRRLNIPYVLTFSADPLFERELVGRPVRGLRRLLAIWETRFAMGQARKIICVSQASKRRLLDVWQVDPEKIVVMANGVDLHRFRPGYDPRPVRASLGVGDAPLIGFVGGFRPWHGIERLVESLARVRRHVSEAKLLLIGDGRARPQIESKVAEMGLKQVVIITGLVPQASVPQMLAAVDVAVLPYPQLPDELWFSPLKLYEYMACGKAVVASRSGQIAEVIEEGENGLLVEPGKVGELSRAIVRLLQNEEERSRLGKRAYEQAVKEHSWERYVERLEGVYRSVV